MPQLKNILQQILDNKTKPIGSLGMLETLALQIGRMQDTVSPSLNNPHILVFAADHGIADTGLVNPYPKAVTSQMVLNFLKGGAAINVLCKLHGIGLTIVDCGVDAHFEKDEQLVHAKAGLGTANYLKENALTEQQLTQCFEHGASAIIRLAQKGTNTIGFGEMGIGNSSSAALIMHHICKLPLDACVGMGTGSQHDAYATKLQTLQQAANFHNLHHEQYDAKTLLQKIGGFEIATMCNAYLEAYRLNMVMVVDGFISTAALLCAYTINPAILSHCIFAHTSGEKGHAAMLKFMGVKPILDLGMRLGEGTGAAMAIPILQSAVAILNEMASFEDAGVAQKHEL